MTAPCKGVLYSMHGACTGHVTHEKSAVVVMYHVQVMYSMKRVLLLCMYMACTYHVPYEKSAVVVESRACSFPL